MTLNGTLMAKKDNNFDNFRRNYIFFHRNIAALMKWHGAVLLSRGSKLPESVPIPELEEGLAGTCKKSDLQSR